MHASLAGVVHGCRCAGCSRQRSRSRSPRAGSCRSRHRLTRFPTRSARPWRCRVLGDTSFEHGGDALREDEWAGAPTGAGAPAQRPSGFHPPGVEECHRPVARHRMEVLCGVLHEVSYLRRRRAPVEQPLPGSRLWRRPFTTARVSLRPLRVPCVSPACPLRVPCGTALQHPVSRVCSARSKVRVDVARGGSREVCAGRDHSSHGPASIRPVEV